jgi:hypothetical protein
MSDVFWTVFTGSATYVVGQIVLKLVIEPAQDLKMTFGVISYSLIERANVISNPGLGLKEIETETAQELRNLASKLRSHLYLIPRYSVTARIFGLPPPAKILAASRALIGLSNGVREPDPPGLTPKRSRQSAIHCVFMNRERLAREGI